MLVDRVVILEKKVVMIMAVKEDCGKVAGPQECAGCGKKIHDKFLLKALEMYWHEDCLKCGCCDCRLGEVGHSLYTKGNLLLCKRDYLRLFGSTGYCAACNKVIPAFEMVMRARANVYHLECFACQQCGHRFCVGDQFYLLDNKILCGSDYEERMLFASLQGQPDRLAQLKNQQTRLLSAQSTYSSSTSSSHQNPQNFNSQFHHNGGPPYNNGGPPGPPGLTPKCATINPLPPIASVKKRTALAM